MGCSVSGDGVTDDAVWQAVVMILVHQQSLAAKARRAEGRGCAELADTLRSKVTELDDHLAMFARRLRSEPSRTREIFKRAVDFADQKGAPEPVRSLVGLHMLVRLERLGASVTRRADLFEAL